MSEKKYTVTTKTAEGWNNIHDYLTSDTSLENIPDRCIACENEMNHSSKRGVFLLTESEAENLRNRSEVASVVLNTAEYLDTEITRIDPDDLKSVLIPSKTLNVTITNNGASDWSIVEGKARNDLVGDDPTMVVAVGDTINITNNASATHPLYIKTQRGAGTNNQVSGVTNQGASGGGIVSWTPSEVGEYYYQCSTHADMSGIINVKSNDQKKPASATPSLISSAEDRYSSDDLLSVKNYMEYGSMPSTPTASDLNRVTSQLWRMTQKQTPWRNQSNNTIITAMPKQRGAGEDIDVVVGDEGTWIAHPEFMMGVTNAVYPANFIAGNALSRRDGSTSDSTCNVLDMFFDGPYYLDKKWFDADESRLETRWDGTVVPTETAARAWWSSSAGRSSDFPDFGGITVTSSYTRNNAGGSNTVNVFDGTHGTPCAGLVYGRTMGWAYNANKWYIDVYSTRGLWFESYFDIMKIFHTYKPINDKYGNKNPTLSSNSWGYRVTPRSSGFYNHRGTDISYTSRTSDSPALMRVAATSGDGRMKHFPKPDVHPELTAADECQESGVILVCAAGNDTQQQVTPDHPNYNNFHNSTAGATWDQTTWTELGGYWQAYATTNRGGFPQIAGQEQSLNDDGVLDTFGTINIGALDDDWADGDPIGTQENKAYYSDFGPAVDCFAVADGTLSAASPNDTGVEQRYDNTYPGLTANSGIGEDTYFNGTSAACPVACGFLCTVMQYNREWTWRELKKWIKDLPQQPTADFAGQNTDYSSATDSRWLTTTNLGGSDPIILYDYGTEQSTFPKRDFNIKGSVGWNNIAQKSNKRIDK